MKITARKIKAGQYAVVAGGRATNLVVISEGPKKYREPAEWTLMQQMPNGGFDYVAGNLRSLNQAVAAVEKILVACAMRETV